MACLEKLQIQGVRSFDPDKPEQLTFYPLTIILGSNGAGKTTLIECLRFAATADFPPQTNRGKTWIHDINCTKVSVPTSFKPQLVAFSFLSLESYHQKSSKIKVSRQR